MATTLYNHTTISGAYNLNNVWAANAYQFRVEVLLNSQDLVNNKSNVTCNFYIKGLNKFYYKGYSNTTAIKLKTSADNSYITKATGTFNSMGMSGVEYKMLSWTGWIDHYQGGTMAADFECTYSGSSGTNFLPRPQDIKTGALTLPRILRQSTIAVTPSLLQKNGTMDIAITRYVNTYTMTVKYEVNGTTVTLGTKSSTLSYSVPYSTIAAYLQQFTAGSIKVTCDTYAGDTLIGSVEQTIMIQTGVIPLSLYDDMEGTAGVTLGQEAQGEGFNCYMPAEFSFDGLTLEGPLVDYVVDKGQEGNWFYRKWASGLAECWKTVSGSVAITTSYSGGFYRSSALGGEDFPTGLFTAAPMVYTGVSNTGGTIIFCTGPQSISALTMGGVVNIHVGSGTYTCQNSFMAVGRWK